VIFLSKVEHSFTIPGRGWVVVPFEVTNRVHIGDAIQLRSPNGDTIDSRIVGIELIKQLSGSCRAAFLLSEDVAPEHSPAETEIWICSHAS